MPKLNIKNDFIFKEVFASNDELSKGALKELVSAYLQRDIMNIEVTKNEIRSSYFLQKETRMDINVIFNDGEMANIEMQLLNQKEDLNARMVYYLTQLFNSQPMKGKSYTSLHNTYTILIANFTFLEDERQYHDFFLQDEERLKFSDLLHIIVIELSKVVEKKVEDMNAIEGWNYFFRNYENEEKTGIIELIKKKWSGVAMADKKITQISPEQMERINQIYDERFRLEEQWRFEEAMEEKYKTGKAEGIKEGIEEGIEEGLQKGIESTIAKMAKKLSVEEISETLDMDIHEIENILNSNKNVQ